MSSQNVQPIQDQDNPQGTRGTPNTGGTTQGSTGTQGNTGTQPTATNPNPATTTTTTDNVTLSPDARPAAILSTNGNTFSIFARAAGQLGPNQTVPTVNGIHQVTRYFGRDPNLPFNYLDDGCYARAEIMSLRLNNMGITNNKIFAQAPDPFSYLRGPAAPAWAARTGQNEVTWGWHVAPQVNAYNPATGNVEPRVIDPGLNPNRSLSPQEWVNGMNRDNIQVRTQVTNTSAYSPRYQGGYFTVEEFAQHTGESPAGTLDRYGNWLRQQNVPVNSNATTGEYSPLPSEPVETANVPGTFGRVMNGVSKVGAGVAIVGGTVQTVNGVNELRNGNTVDGTADTGSGVSSITAGALTLAGGTAATVGAPIAGGAAMLFDGTRDIIHGAQNGNNEQLGVGIGKDLGGSLMVAGGVVAATGLGAPLGLGIAAAGGVIYLGSTAYEYRHEIGNFFSNVFGSGENARPQTAATQANDDDVIRISTTIDGSKPIVEQTTTNPTNRSLEAYYVRPGTGGRGRKLEPASVAPEGYPLTLREFDMRGYDFSQLNMHTKVLGFQDGHQEVTVTVRYPNGELATNQRFTFTAAQIKQMSNAGQQ